MNFFRIQGSHPLQGEITIPGSKNAALPMLCASLLTEEPCEFHNVPNITDIDKLLEIFQILGAKVERDLSQKKVRITARQLDAKKISQLQLIKKFRASLLVLGPLLARCQEALILQPGGCILGTRSNTTHLKGFQELGVNITEDPHSINARVEKPIQDTTILLPEASVTATENLALFAAYQPTQTTITFAATEPHVTATLRMLQAMGAEIKGLQTHHLTIQGTPKLKGGVFTIPPDSLLAGTYALAGILTNGKITIHSVPHDELFAFYGLLRQTGAAFEFSAEKLEILPRSTPLQSPGKVQTAIFPGFSTDLQSPFGVLLTQCQGTSLIFETLFENRFSYIYELEKMGAQIQMLNAYQVQITGATSLRGRMVESWDLRAGAAMVLAGLVAKGETCVTQIDYIKRGYENFAENLQALGAQITEVQSG